MTLWTRSMAARSLTELSRVLSGPHTEQGRATLFHITCLLTILNLPTKPFLRMKDLGNPHKRLLPTRLDVPNTKRTLARISGRRCSVVREGSEVLGGSDYVVPLMLQQPGP